MWGRGPEERRVSNWTKAAAEMKGAGGCCWLTPDWKMLALPNSASRRWEAWLANPFGTADDTNAQGSSCKATSQQPLPMRAWKPLQSVMWHPGEAIPGVWGWGQERWESSQHYHWWYGFDVFNLNRSTVTGCLHTDSENRGENMLQHASLSSSAQSIMPTNAFIPQASHSQYGATLPRPLGPHPLRLNHPWSWWEATFTPHNCSHTNPPQQPLTH